MNSELLKTDTVNESGEKVNLTDDLMITVIVTDVFFCCVLHKGRKKILNEHILVI